MCLSCWEEAGSPRDESAAVKTAARLIADLYAANGAGGLLHVAVDDFNLEDRDVAWCRAEMESPSGQAFMANEGSVTEHWNALVALEGLTKRQRWAAVALHDGYWKPEPEEVTQT